MDGMPGQSRDLQPVLLGSSGTQKVVPETHLVTGPSPAIDFCRGRYSLISEACALGKERTDLRFGRVPFCFREGDCCRTRTPKWQHESGPLRTPTGCARIPQGPRVA